MKIGDIVYYYEAPLISKAKILEIGRYQYKIELIQNSVLSNGLIIEVDSSTLYEEDRKLTLIDHIIGDMVTLDSAIIQLQRGLL